MRSVGQRLLVAFAFTLTVTTFDDDALTVDDPTKTALTLTDDEYFFGSVTVIRPLWEAFTLTVLTTFFPTYTLTLPVAYAPVLSRPTVTVALGRVPFENALPVTFGAALSLALTTLNVFDRPDRASSVVAVSETRAVTAYEPTFVVRLSLSVARPLTIFAVPIDEPPRRNVTVPDVRPVTVVVTDATFDEPYVCEVFDHTGVDSVTFFCAGGGVVGVVSGAPVSGAPVVGGSGVGGVVVGGSVVGGVVVGGSVGGIVVGGSVGGIVVGGSVGGTASVASTTVGMVVRPGVNVTDVAPSSVVAFPLYVVTYPSRE